MADWPLSVSPEATNKRQREFASLFCRVAVETTKATPTSAMASQNQRKILR